MKLIKSFSYALNGLKTCFSSETNFKIHLLAALIAILLGIGLHISMTEWMIVLICFAMVLFAELLNTAMEKLCDVVQPAFHPAIKKIKDMAAGAVLIAAAASFIVGVIIFLPKLIELIKSF